MSTMSQTEEIRFDEMVDEAFAAMVGADFDTVARELLAADGCPCRQERRVRITAARARLSFMEMLGQLTPDQSFTVRLVLAV